MRPSRARLVRLRSRAAPHYSARMTRTKWSVGVAIALLLTACGSEPGGPRCVEYYDGCICGAEPREDDVPFAGTCDQAGVGLERGICCRDDDSCRCEPVVCGFDVDDPTCLCGLGFSHDTV